jgi:hypothetical protein
MEVWLLNLAVLVSWLFTLLAWSQWSARRKLHQGVWTLGLLSFAIGVTCEAVARGQGAWTETTYRLWYFTGAMHGVTWLGQGTLHLMDRRAWTNRMLEVLVVLAVITGIVVMNAPINFANLATPFEPSGKAFNEIKAAGWATPRAWTIPFNIYGTIWLVGGAFVSSFNLWRINRPRALGTLLIALAGLGLASTSSLNRFGISGLETVGRLLGISVLFVGFLITNLEANAFAGIRLPRPQPMTVLAVTGWTLALAAFFKLEPAALKFTLESPGLVLIGGFVLAFMVLVILKARQRTQKFKSLGDRFQSGASGFVPGLLGDTLESEHYPSDSSTN